MIHHYFDHANQGASLRGRGRGRVRVGLEREGEARLHHTQHTLTTPHHPLPLVMSVEIGARLHHTQHSPINRKKNVTPK